MVGESNRAPFFLMFILKKTIIGAGFVVTKDIPEYCIAVGNPAKVIKNLI